MDRRGAGGNRISGRRRGAGTVWRYLAESCDDLHGMYRNRVRNYDEQNTTCRTASFYHHYKRIHVWFPERKNIPGRIEICMRSRPELLFLPGSAVFLSGRRLTGIVKPAGIPGAF